MDFDIEVTILPWDSEDGRTHSYTINHINTYANIKNKMVNGENLKYKVKFIEYDGDDVYWYLNIMPQVQYHVENDFEYIGFLFVGYSEYEVVLCLMPDDTVVDDT